MTKIKIKNILGKQLGIEADTISSSASLVTDLGADSLDLIEIVMKIEEAFNVAIEETEYLDAQTVNGIADLIARKKQSNNSG
jgi:acyl carrier protein